MKTKKRSNKTQRKKQILVLLVAAGILFAGVGGYVYRILEEKPSYSVSYKKREKTDDVIEHKGKKYRYNEHLSNYLFLGIDSRNAVDTYEGQQDAGQADVIFLVSLDRAKKNLQVLAIPRDTMTQIEVFTPGGKSLGMDRNHINLQYAFGDGKRESCELMKTAVSNLLHQVPIENYCSINMDGIPVLTQIVEGVEVVVPDNSLEEINPEFKEGAAVVLTEENTEQFLRSRDVEESQSALVRMNHQKVFLKAYLERVQEIADKDAGIVTELYEGLKPYMVTGMSNDLFAKLLEASMTNTPTLETLPGEGTEGKYFDEYHVNDEELYDLVIRMFYEEVNE